jgi:uncharacterized pyridoxal phosphate-containing UPF0001 family protein
MTTVADRRAELAAGLSDTERRIADACAGAGRSRDEITLVVVTKTYPASDVEMLAELGVVDVGENRHPEAGDKAHDVEAPMRWHFLGGLQTNKAGAVARYADLVHSVDRSSSSTRCHAVPRPRIGRSPASSRSTSTPPIPAARAWCPTASASSPTRSRVLPASCSEVS